jgi:4-amino-4-deoxy-L-arabinose transferase-like glycosyltransferase
VRFADKRWLVPALLLLFCLLSARGIVSNSSTMDETHYFGMGHYLLTHMRWDVPGSILHPPLAYYVASVPFFFVHTDQDVWNYPEQARKHPGFLTILDILRGQTLLSSPANADDRLLILSRLMFLPLCCLLGYFVYLFAGELYGWQGGLAALVLYVFSPNMLAHSGLITPDMTLTAFFFIAVYFFRKALIAGSTKQFIIAGVALGLALLSKFTAVLLFPIEAVLLLFFVRNKTGGGYAALLKHIALMLLCAVFIVFLGYGFVITPYLQGIFSQLKHAAEGNYSYLMGAYSTEGWWYYFIAAFLLKTPVPALLLFSLSFAFFFNAVKGKKSWRDGLFLLVPIVVVFGFFSIKHQVCIGLRYVLPVYPFIFVLAGGAVAQLKKARIFSYALMAYYIAVCFWISPHYLAYFNEFAGGPANGYRYLVDSNLDWGQDLKGLKQYMDQHGIDRIYLSYFGSDSPQRYGIKYDWLPSPLPENPEPLKRVRIPTKGYVAVSVTDLQGVFPGTRNMFQWLAPYKPIAKIGYSIFLYRIG